MLHKVLQLAVLNLISIEMSLAVETMIMIMKRVSTFGFVEILHRNHYISF